jgi:hypothetical protein
VPRLTVKQQSLSDIFEDMARLHLDHRPGAPAGRVIAIEANGRTVRAIARGAPNNRRDTIHLDSAMRQRLGVKPNQVVDFTIRIGNWRDDIAWAWHATNAMPRIAIRLATLSVALGVVGLMLGAISLFK